MTDYHIAPAQAFQLLAIAEMLRDGDLKIVPAGWGGWSDGSEDANNAVAALIDVSQEIALQHIGMPDVISNQKLNTTFQVEEPTENIMDDLSGRMAGNRAADMQAHNQAYIKKAAQQGRDTNDEYYKTPPPSALRDAGPLAAITDHIMRAVNQILEISYKLNEHADAVHGPVPESNTVNAAERGMPESALQRVFFALEQLDRSHKHVAEAAGRNCTLA